MPSSSYLCSLASAMTWGERKQMHSLITVLFTRLTRLETTQNDQRLPLGNIRQSGRQGFVYSKSLSATFAGGDASIMNLFLSLVISFHLSAVSNLSDDLAHILNHHLVCCYRLHGKQSPLVDVTPAETNPLLSKLIWENNHAHKKRKKIMSKCEKYLLQIATWQLTCFRCIWTVVRAKQTDYIHCIYSSCCVCLATSSNSTILKTSVNKALVRYHQYRPW